MLRSLARKLLKIMSVLSTSSLNQTMPQRDTVARVAYFRSCTSNIIRTLRERSADLTTRARRRPGC